MIQNDINARHSRSRIVKEYGPISPGSPPSSRFPLSSASPAANDSFRQYRIRYLSNYRRELAVLETSRTSHIQHNPLIINSSSQPQAPWNASSSSNGATPVPALVQPTGGGVGTTFLNDSSDNISVASAQLSPPLQSTASRGGLAQTPGSSDSMDPSYHDDERRPSIASITTLSSQGSKSSNQRGGFRKLQHFFGEEFVSRDGSDQSLSSGVIYGKERSHSYSHITTSRPGRERNYSNATDHTRDASPASSRPRTPIPSSDVVPFLYQEAEVVNPPSKSSQAPSARYYRLFLR